MNNKPFGQLYSSLYDKFYAEKNYNEECNFLESLINKHSSVKTILDLGCGTGGHLIPLLQRGYIVDGLDISKEMLNFAQERLDKNNLTTSLFCSDIRDFQCNKKYDAVFSSFAVLSYMISNDDLLNVFKSVRTHLNNKGTFIFDCWFGPAVLKNRPSTRTKHIEDGNKSITRTSMPTLQLLNHTVSTVFKILVVQNKTIIHEEEETHLNRFFFTKELEYFLNVVGFTTVKFCPFLKVDATLSEDDWYLTCIAHL